MTEHEKHWVESYNKRCLDLLVCLTNDMHFCRLSIERSDERTGDMLLLKTMYDNTILMNDFAQLPFFESQNDTCTISWLRGQTIP